MTGIENAMRTQKTLQVICKISKFCNLRCNYCYEYPDLAKRDRMQLDDIGRMFATLRRYVDENPGTESIVFYWQGGEPLLIKPEVYVAIGELSREAFAGSVSVVHTVQTNLTVMSPPWLDFLSERRFFTDVSISFDVVGEERVDVKGKSKNAAVMANIQKLFDAGISFGAIAVVARHSVDHVRNIYRFYDELGVYMRFLPFYVSASAGQIEAHGLTADQIVGALCAVFDEWISSETATSVEPLNTYLEYALDFVQGIAPRSRDIPLQESMFLVTPNGDTWGIPDMYVPGASYGNIFRDDFADMLRGPARQKALGEARRRMDSVCTSCPYFGPCPGYAVAQASPDERVHIDNSGCMLRAVLDHIVMRLEQAGIQDAIRNMALPVRRGAALEVTL